MNVIMTARNLKISDSTRNWIEDHLDKLTKYDHRLLSGRAILIKEHDNYIAEVDLKSKNEEYFCKESSDDLQISLNGVIEKLEKQLRKHKTKVQAKKNVKKISELTSDMFSGDRTVKEDPEIIEYRYDIRKPQTVDDAIVEMNERGYLFKVFLNTDTSQVNIVFHQKDGNYGLIIP